VEQPPPPQQPSVQLQQIRAKVQQILTANEVILHLAVQSTPLNPVANLTSDCAEACRTLRVRNLLKRESKTAALNSK
jgi:hypothetical protein